ncbi:phosphotransferase [Photobacterium iliopiscarium]|uniref:Phosphotransferase n=1 Tax=Photobacterium iliopiscarium TaxID=56192 RepID=A0ABX5GXE2_9GAMM|nr:phosphotransferase [Photobacterium iliopiscarium]KJG26564.1 phosphotransferase [Photobacterium iliopiscarium]PSW99496.1 phosphotransferase [Photobacterium iliopiscarium]
MVDDEHFDCDLLIALPDTELISASVLTGGLTNRCWKLTLFHPSINHSKEYVWRPFSTSTQVFGIERQHEYQLLSLIADTELAPKPLQLVVSAEPSAEKSTSQSTTQVIGLVVEWLSGVEATTVFSDQRLCQLQAKVHQLPLPWWRLDVHQRAEHYWQYLHTDHHTSSLFSIYRFFQSQPLPVAFDDCCCHFDLGRYNVIVPSINTDTIASAKIIDWEYAAAGDPSLDLAMTIIANALDIEQAVHDYCDYRALINDETVFNKQQWLTAVIAWLPWCQYLALLWYLIGYDLWQQPEYLQQALQLQQQLIEYINK